MKLTRRAALAASCAGIASIAMAQDEGEEGLVDDPSRSQLGEYDLLTFGSPADKSVRRNFGFPHDADDGEYGFDISHHNYPLNWGAVRGKNASFVYMKSSEGGRFVDKRFAEYWQEAGKIGLRRGAYHFLSAQVSGDQQVANFLRQFDRVKSDFRDTDLAPVLDIEWDKGGGATDRWSTKSPAQISALAKDWLVAVERATGRKPMIYTAASWWNPRIKRDLTLLDYKIWIADYRNSTFNAGFPLTIKDANTVAWQFTDIGAFTGGNRRVDVNKVLGEMDDLVGRSGA